jgi:hypothetical protein
MSLTAAVVAGVEAAGTTGKGIFKFSSLGLVLAVLGYEPVFFSV